MSSLENLRFTESHEWIKVEGEVAYVGITDHAQSELGDIVFVEVETVGETLNKEEVFGTIEAVKTVTDVYMPIGGEILEFNEKLSETPELINKDTYNEGWIVKIKMTDPNEVNSLLTAKEYNEKVN